MTRARGQLVPLRRTTPSDLSDEGLVAACAAGDRAARALLFERHVDAVAAMIARLAGAEPAAIDDLVQATFLTAFRAAAGFRGASAVRTWLIGIATNVVRNHARREVRRRVALGSFADQAQRTVGGGGEERVVLGRVARALGELPAPLREVFVLVDIEGLRGADAARALGVPEGTVWRRLHQARTALRAQLGDVL
jgi:RNA polymerase sigma-70 factor (ECF subfamily)